MLQRRCSHPRGSCRAPVLATDVCAPSRGQPGISRNPGGEPRERARGGGRSQTAAKPLARPARCSRTAPEHRAPRTARLRCPAHGPRASPAIPSAPGSGEGRVTPAVT
uniref:Uncharacterized protein n=1 Tax=Strigops habroptila TaxID=2489341 RepID=A0A672UJC0_STRHB